MDVETTMASPPIVTQACQPRSSYVDSQTAQPRAYESIQRICRRACLPRCLRELNTPLGKKAYRSQSTSTRRFHKTPQPKILSYNSIVKSLDVSSVQYLQSSENKFGRCISPLSSRISWQSRSFGRKYVSTTPIVTASFENRGILDSKSTSPPPLLDGTTRLYFSSRCPYAQRVWVTVKYKNAGKLVYLTSLYGSKRRCTLLEKLGSRQVPALEHDGKVIGESMDLLNYFDEHFERPKLAPIVDIAYAPFIERFELAFGVIRHFDIKAGLPKLAKWIEVLSYNHKKATQSRCI